MFRLPPEKKKEVIKRFCICSITAGNLGQNICHMFHALYIHIRETFHKSVAWCIFSGFEKTRHFHLKFYSTSHSTRIYTLSQVSQVFTCSTNCKHLTLRATILHVGLRRSYLTYVHK